MKMFRTKYFALSFIIHFALISLLITYKNISEKAETTMLVTEIIKIKESSELKKETSELEKEKSELNNEKKTSDSEIKIVNKVNVKIKKPLEKKFPTKINLKSANITEKLKSNKFDNKKIKGENNTVKKYEPCILRKGVEFNNYQSFIACISDILFDSEKSIIEMKEIMMQAISDAQNCAALWKRLRQKMVLGPRPQWYLW